MDSLPRYQAANFVFEHSFALRAIHLSNTFFPAPTTPIHKTSVPDFDVGKTLRSEEGFSLRLDAQN